MRKMGFSKAQEEAIRHNQGPMMVLAGPGSGKTTVITHRVQYLTAEAGVRPDNILVITFTRAAAEEMKGRYRRITGHADAVSFGTFHAVFFRILKLAYGYSADSIIRENEQRQLVREAANSFRLEPEDENEFLQSLLGEISSVKCTGTPLEHYYAACCPEEIFRQIYLDYDGKMRRMGKLDFDDMMVMCRELFQQRKDILSAWQRRYRYILIDEFQDINRMQYEIVRLLAEPLQNLFIVGDDDQSIYGFRGAKPEIMLGFEKDYPHTARVLLNQNFRSTAEIAEASLRVIGHNRKRFQKEILPQARHGKPVITAIWANPREEARQLALQIKTYQAAGIPLSEIAVLYRTNDEPRALMEILMEYHLPFRTRDRVPSLYDHWIVRDIFTYIRLAQGERSRGDFYRVMNRPTRYISREAVPHQTFSFSALKAYYQDKDWMLDRIVDLEFDLKAVSSMSPFEAVRYIRKNMGYDTFLREYAAAHRVSPEDLLETAEELTEQAEEYPTYALWAEHIRAYEEELTQQARRRDETEEAVTLTTMHSAKGLEFDVVFIIDANEGVTPHHKALLDEDLEEERRLFYVAMTRARTRLHVFSCRERYRKPAEVSRFVAELSGGTRIDEKTEKRSIYGSRSHHVR